ESLYPDDTCARLHARGGVRRSREIICTQLTVRVRERPAGIDMYEVLLHERMRDPLRQGTGPAAMRERRCAGRAFHDRDAQSPGACLEGCGDRRDATAD